MDPSLIGSNSLGSWCSGLTSLKKGEKDVMSYNPRVYQNPRGELFLFLGKTPRKVKGMSYKDLVDEINRKRYLSKKEKELLLQKLQLLPEGPSDRSSAEPLENEPKTQLDDPRKNKRSTSRKTRRTGKKNVAR
jgi:hypothetical protein